MLPVINLGPLAIQTPGLLLLIGLWLGLTMAEKHAPLYQLDSSQVYNLTLVSILSGLIGGRLAYVVRFLSSFSQDPLSLISLNPVMFDLSSGVVLGLLASVVYISRIQVPFWSMMDALTSLFGVMLIAVGAANLASGDAFGMPADIAWAIHLWGEWRHPVQVYEMILGAGILWITLPTGFLRTQMLSQPGMRFWLFCAAAALSRLFLEAFRGDSALVLDSIRSVQITAWLLLAISLWQMNRRLRSTQKGEE